MRLLSGQKPHNLAADLPAGARHRDTHHALLALVGRLELDGYMRPECPAAITDAARHEVPNGSYARLPPADPPRSAISVRLKARTGLLVATPWPG
jgi:hypothetical protein